MIEERLQQKTGYKSDDVKDVSWRKCGFGHIKYYNMHTG